MIGDVIVIALIALIVGGAAIYIIRAKRRGQKCIGCPYAKQCGKCTCGESKSQDKNAEN